MILVDRIQSSTYQLAKDAIERCAALLLHYQEERKQRMATITPEPAKWQTDAIQLPRIPTSSLDWQPSPDLEDRIDTHRLPPHLRPVAGVDYRPYADLPTMAEVPAIPQVVALPPTAQQLEPMITQVDAMLLMASPKATAPIPIVELAEYANKKYISRTAPPGTILRDAIVDAVGDFYAAFRVDPSHILMSKDNYKMILPFLTEFKNGFVISDNPAVPTIPFGIDPSLDSMTIVCLSI